TTRMRLLFTAHSDLSCPHPVVRTTVVHIKRGSHCLRLDATDASLCRHVCRVELSARFQGVYIIFIFAASGPLPRKIRDFLRAHPAEGAPHPAPRTPVESHPSPHSGTP